MKKRFLIGLSAFALATVAATAQIASPALSGYLGTHAEAVVYFHTTQTLPNGMSADFYGTGFVIDASGHVLTAAHVADDITRETIGEAHADEMIPGATYKYEGSLGSENGPKLLMDLVELDDLRDLALFKLIEPAVYQHFEVASGVGLNTPEQVLALGYPVGSDASVPALGRITDTTRKDGRWLISAPVNHGHSGGPVVRRDGAVVGVVHAGFQGAALMNLMLPLKATDPILVKAGVTQNTRTWPPATAGIPERTKFDDIAVDGACSDRSPIFEDAAKSIHWTCAEATVPRGVGPNVEKTKPVRVLIPSSAEILDVRYFHRSRGDWQAPVENGPWHANPPDVDLQWMMIDAGVVFGSGTDQLIQAQCRNWAHDMASFCAIGVQYKMDAWLW
jgi:Trypsin-like peptidase domain